MFNDNVFRFCSEAYLVEKSIEVVVTLNITGESACIKIDALKDGRSGSYSTKAYIEEHVTLQPTFPKTEGSHDRQPDDFRIWVPYNLPWTNRNSADEALRQALDFLREGCQS